MKLKIMAVLLIFGICSCHEEPIKKYKYVINVSTKTVTYPVTITEHSNNALKRTAGGAIVGGALGYFIGTGIAETAIAGAATGAATTNGETSKSYTKQQTDIYYTVIFNDSSKTYSVNYCYYSVGDSVQIF